MWAELLGVAAEQEAQGALCRTADWRIQAAGMCPAFRTLLGIIACIAGLLNRAGTLCSLAVFRCIRAGIAGIAGLLSQAGTACSQGGFRMCLQGKVCIAGLLSQAGIGRSLAAVLLFLAGSCTGNMFLWMEAGTGTL